MTAQSDEQIHHQVLHELKLDDSVKHTEVGVQVNGGIVTLTGIVSCFSTKLAACAAAHRARNVRDVADNLQIKDLSYTGPSDTQVAQSVRDALRMITFLPEQMISTTVAHGMVSVFGTVGTTDQNKMVIEAIFGVPGVLDIVDMIDVSDSAMVPLSKRSCLTHLQTLP